MLSYRHAFHAGNHADVLKHTTLTLLLNSLKRKEKPFIYIDTHAGAGRYQLQSEWALKTQEAQSGIMQLWTKRTPTSLLNEYWQVIHHHNPKGQLRIYPGSPLLTRHLIREQDRMVLMELHPHDSKLLKQCLGQDKRVRIIIDDGFHTLISQLPPLIKRGLVLIDPSYEIKKDYPQVVTTLQQAYKRWATGTYVIWYPLLSGTHHLAQNMLKKITQDAYTSLLRVELEVNHAQQRGMYGSGLLIINPPWQLDSQLNTLLPLLAKELGENNHGYWRVEWLKNPEQ